MHMETIQELTGRFQTLLEKRTPSNVSRKLWPCGLWVCHGLKAEREGLKMTSLYRHAFTRGTFTEASASSSIILLLLSVPWQASRRCRQRPSTPLPWVEREQEFGVEPFAALCGELPLPPREGAPLGQHHHTVVKRVAFSLLKQNEHRYKNLFHSGWFQKQGV